MFGGDQLFHYHRRSNCSLVYPQPVPDIAASATSYPGNDHIYIKPTRITFNTRERLYLKTRLGDAHLEAPVSGRPRNIDDVIPWVPNGKVPGIRLRKRRILTVHCPSAGSARV